MPWARELAFDMRGSGLWSALVVNAVSVVIVFINVTLSFINYPCCVVGVTFGCEQKTETSSTGIIMNNHTSPLPAANTERRRLLSRWLVAILLGFVSLFLLFFLGESFGEPAMYMGVGAFSLCAQLFLSRGHVAALRKDWPIILCLNFMVLVSTVLCLALEHNNPAAHLTALVLAGVAVACSYAGAWLAACIARNRILAV